MSPRRHVRHRRWRIISEARRAISSCHPARHRHDEPFHPEPGDQELELPRVDPNVLSRRVAPWDQVDPFKIDVFVVDTVVVVRQRIAALMRVPDFVFDLIPLRRRAEPR